MAQNKASTQISMKISNYYPVSNWMKRFHIKIGQASLVYFQTDNLK